MTEQHTDLLFVSGAKATGLPTPTADSDVATKAYVDAASGGGGSALAARPLAARDLYFDDENIPTDNLAVAAADVPQPSVGFSVGNKAFADFLAQGTPTATLAVDVYWYAAGTPTSGNCRFQARVKAITPITDSTNVETDTGYGTAADTQTAHLGTTAKRLHRTTVSITSLDGMAAGDIAKLELSRIAASASEMTGAANVVFVALRWA